MTTTTLSPAFVPQTTLLSNGVPVVFIQKPVTKLTLSTAIPGPPGVKGDKGDDGAADIAADLRAYYILAKA
jgi:hypothetical protein